MMPPPPKMKNTLQAKEASPGSWGLPRPKKKMSSGLEQDGWTRSFNSQGTRCLAGNGASPENRPLGPCQIPLCFKLAFQ